MPCLQNAGMIAPPSPSVKRVGNEHSLFAPLPPFMVNLLALSMRQCQHDSTFTPICQLSDRRCTPVSARAQMPAGALASPGQRPDGYLLPSLIQPHLVHHLFEQLPNAREAPNKQLGLDVKPQPWKKPSANEIHRSRVSPVKALKRLVRFWLPHVHSLTGVRLKKSVPVMI